MEAMDHVRVEEEVTVRVVEDARPLHAAVEHDLWILRGADRIGADIDVDLRAL